jgi:hypothetical protein
MPTIRTTDIVFVVSGINYLPAAGWFDYFIYLFISAKRSIFFKMAQYNELFNSSFAGAGL